MNQKELFYSFVGSDEYLPVMHHPFELNGVVYATDAHTMIWASKDLIDFELVEPCAKVPSADKVIPDKNIDVPLVIDWSMFDSIQKIEEIIEQECEECEGHGNVEYIYEAKDGEDYTKFHDCPICDGTGNGEKIKTGRMVYPHTIIEIVKGETSIWFELNIFSKIKLLQDFTGEEVRLLSFSAPTKAILVQSGKYSLLVMPTLQGEEEPKFTIKP